LTGYFAALCSALDDRSIRRGITLPEANYLGCQTWIEGTFLPEFTYSPAGPLAPNGQRVVWSLTNICRLDEDGRLVEEWVNSDNRNVLRQLGAAGR
jgi:hypothetical protein